LDKLRINGGQRLRGVVKIAGAKNAALPALAASLLTDQPLVLSNLPRVRDVRTMLCVLEQLGASVDASGRESASVQFDRIGSFEAPYDQISLQHGYIEARADRLHGAHIAFAGKSVTGTENLMMAAALAEGTTVLTNCAVEPEVVDLATMLIGMGASIEGAGSDEIVIEGRPKLGGAEHRVIPDRIEAGTYLIAGAMIGDALELQGCRQADLEPLLQQLELVGVDIHSEGDSMRLSAPERLEAQDLRTAPHPGFPTDMQAQYMAMMTQAHGTALISETVFERRFMHVGELLRMGADIRIDGHSSVVVGPRPLTGAQVMATDLRASASLVLAALVADGATVVDRVYHLDRGYEAMESKLQALGASVERIR